MNKKAIRKELELILIKTIEGVLNSRNALAASKIKKTTFESSRVLAKKFYKAEKKLVPSKKNVKKPIKSVVTKVKAKAKK